MRYLALLLILAACSEPQPSSAPNTPQPPKPVALDAINLDAAVDGSAVFDAAGIDAVTDARVIDAGAARVVRDAGTGKRLAGHNQVCRSGARGGLEESRDVAECEPGLQCCYPCGIQGCAWVCHTPAECRADMTRP